MPFQIGNNCKFVYSVYVARNFPYQCIIALDILMRCACCVDLGNDCVYVNHDNIMFENSDEMCVNEIEVHSFDGMELIVYSTDVLENTLLNVNDSFSSNENEKLHVLLEKIEFVFAFNDFELEHSIDTCDSKSIHQRPYRIPRNSLETNSRIIGTLKYKTV